VARTPAARAGFLRDRRGATAAEYALLLAVIAGGLALSAAVLGESISGALTNTSALMNQSGGCDNNGRGTGFGGGNGGGTGQGAGHGQGNSCYDWSVSALIRREPRGSSRAARPVRRRAWRARRGCIGGRPRFL
jgi:Flp pilus assembly pilin Flp